MVSAEQFLDALALQGAVDRDVLDGMRQEITSRGDSVTAQALATRLVAMGAITSDQADRLLMPASDSFIQVGAEALSDSPSASSSAATASASSSRINPAPPPSFEDPEDLYGDGDGPRKPEKKRRRHVKKGAENEFDSPLLLIGGGGLVLLVLCGVGLALLLTQRSGDEVLESARTAYETGSYAAAAKAYEEFVEDFPTHGRWSEARVALAATRLRQAVESGRDWPAALSVAEVEVRAVEDEPAFADNRAEFAALLPRVAVGLAQRADSQSAELSSGGDDAEVARLAELADQALTLAVNTKYAPKSLQDPTQATAVRELLARVERRRASASDLSAAVAAIAAATAAGEPGEAYRLHRELLAARPELRDDAALEGALAAAAEAERSLVAFAPSEADAASVSRDDGVAASIALATIRREGTVAADGVYAVKIGPILCGINAANGVLRWRRPIGDGLSRSLPTPVGEDLVVVDQRHGDLLRLRASDGSLVWRTPLEETRGAGWFTPALVGDRLLVGNAGGRLWAVDVGSGARQGVVGFAQPLASAPAVHPDGTRVYVVGRQAVVYTLDAESLDAAAVSYTGHAAEACPVSPIVIPGGLVLAENVGVATSRLRVCPLDGARVTTEEAYEVRLDGLIDSPLLVAGSRLLAGARSGGATLMEIAANPDETPLATVASAPVPSRATAPARFAMAGSEIWIATRGLQRTAASLADSQLVSATVADPCSGDAFFGTLERRGRALLHSRRRRGASGVTVGATDARTGRLVWETDLATPPIAAPRASRSPRGMVTVDRAGVTHLLTRTAIAAGVSLAQPEAARRSPSWRHATLLAGGAGLLTTVESPDAKALNVGDAGSLISLPGRPACRPTPLGRVALVPLAIGQVSLVGTDGAPVGAPFMPEVEVGAEVGWTPAAVGRVADATLAVLTNGRASAYCLDIRGGASPGLTLREERPINGATPIGPAAIAGDHAAIGLTGGRVALFPLPGFDSPRVVELGDGGEIAWGPYAAGGAFVVWLADGTLVAVDPASSQIAWRLGLNEPVGDPLVADGSLVLATRVSELVRVGLDSGELVGRRSLGQPLGTGPTAYGSRLLVAAEDGTVLVTGMP